MPNLEQNALLGGSGTCSSRKIWTLKLFNSLSSIFVFSLAPKPLPPRIRLLILLSSCCTFRCKLVARILFLDQDNHIYLIHLSILMTCLLDSGWILKGEDTCEPLLGVKGLQDFFPFFWLAVVITGTLALILQHSILQFLFFEDLMLFFLLLSFWLRWMK